MIIRRRIAMLAIFAGLAGASAASAAPGIAPGTEPHNGRPERTASNAHKLVSVVIDTGDPFSTIPSGYTTIDTTTAVCGKPTCSIAVDISAQLGGQATAGNRWAVCAVVDGATAPLGCPFLGELPVDGTFVIGAGRQTFDVSKGTHTVGFEIYEDDSAIAGNYDVQYQVLTP
jgi:hypothetical protein